MGEDIPDATDGQSFEYTGISITAQANGTQVQMDANNDGVNFYLVAGTRNYYTPAGNTALPDLNTTGLFEPLRSQMVCPKGAHPDYRMPLPWIP